MSIDREGRDRTGLSPAELRILPRLRDVGQPLHRECAAELGGEEPQ